MVMVTAICGFSHGSSRKRGECFEVSDSVAERLRRKGLVQYQGGGAEASGLGPSSAAGAPSSASRAAQASPQTTAKPSASGGRKRASAPAQEPPSSERQSELL